MKILTTKKYNQLLEEKERLEKEKRDLHDKNEELQKEIEDKNTFFGINSEDFFTALISLILIGGVQCENAGFKRKEI